MFVAAGFEFPERSRDDRSGQRRHEPRVQERFAENVAQRPAQPVAERNSEAHLARCRMQP